VFKKLKLKYVQSLCLITFRHSLEWIRKLKLRRKLYKLNKSSMNKKAKKRFKIISDYSIKSDKTRLAKVCPRVEKTAATSQI
jgi:hypothetical protein